MDQSNSNLRAIAILHTNPDMSDNVQTILKHIRDNALEKSVFVFTSLDAEQFNVADQTLVSTGIKFPADRDTEPKRRNWILDYFKTMQFSGMLHIVSDTTCLSTGAGAFMNDIEHMMDMLDYDLWFSTVSDPCNYVYNKFVPRISINLDDEKFAPLNLSKTILFTSHSNTQWMIYNLGKISDEMLRFDERFTIPMYYIIELLTRRKKLKAADQLYFMNQYMTVNSERDAYTCLTSSSTSEKVSNQVAAQEDAIFNSLNTDHAPDNNFDKVLELTYQKLSSKLSTRV